MRKKLKAFVAWVRSLGKGKPPIAVTKPKDEQPVSSADTWPAYRCDRYFGHEYAEENQVRLVAIAACRAAVFDCIRCLGGKPSDEVAVHLLHFRSPVDHEFKLGKNNWYNQALAKGVTRYQIVIEPANAKRWNELVIDYPANTVQFMAADVEVVKKTIKDRPVVQLID